jgi:23S rRNA pseudouridine2605 synthase
MEERLQKILAHAGIASRRRAETLIREGRVTVNGVAVTELGSKADLDKDAIAVDGKKIRRPQRMVYVLLNKPKNVMSTSSDPEGRPTVLEYIREEVHERVYPVGRLDFASEGLLVLTNDGEFTRFMTQAGTVPKVYRVKVAGRPADRDLDRLRRGLFLDGKRLAPCEIVPVTTSARDAENPWFEVTLHQGKNQQIRRMFGVLGHPVEKLRRIRIGFLEDVRLLPGAWRFLTEREVGRFYKDYGAGPERKARRA